ncbi:MAG: plastocyanin/azurin family copper-binding protein [Acidimicrobiales bacterium]
MEPSDGRPATTRTRSRIRPLAGVLVVALFAAFAVAGPVKILVKRSEKAQSAAGAATVTMAGLKFSPATLTVARGTEVLFDNNDVAPHTVTADVGTTDSGILQPTKAFRFVVNERFVYHCSVHPSMKATIDVSG